MADETVLVTGGSGFLGAHCLAALLRQGYTVRTTLRSPKREPEVLAMLSEAGVDPKDKLSFFTADLSNDDGWAEAVAGCDYVLHVASPFPLGIPAHEDELIIPAKEGALRVLLASRDAGVKRVVMTSSFAAIGYGHKNRTTPFTERDWSKTEGLQAYPKSKTIAERAAWDFIEAEGNGLELSVINPVGIFGPALGTDLGTSLEIIRQIISGSFPRLPKINIAVVDVRDAADLHLLAMTNPKAAGERFIATVATMTMPEMGQMLKDGLGPEGTKVPTKPLPDFLVRLLAMVNPQVRQLSGELGSYRDATGEKARTVLGWQPRSAEEALISGARSALEMQKRKNQAS